MEPFFIVGFQRSGTTLLRLMLDSHPEIAIPLDTVGLWARYDHRLDQYNFLREPADRRRLIADLLSEERIRLWEVPLAVDVVLGRCTTEGLPGIIEGFYRSYAAAKGKRFWGDKDPGNMTRIALLDRWFPRSRIIHIVRDGRDACLSHLTQEFGFSDILECAECWREQVWWVRQMGQLLGAPRYLEVRYEDLLAEPERKLREICDLLDVKYSPQMLRYHEHVEQSIPASKRHLWALIDRPPQRDNAGRWKREMSSGLRLAFEKRAGSVLQELGYPALPGRASGAYAEELRSLVRRATRALRRRLGPMKRDIPS